MTGAVSWIAVAVITGKREAWDATAYWTLAYPVALVVCGWLGYVHPIRAWRWAAILFLAQFVAMVALNGEWGSIVPLGLVLVGVIALPGAAAAMLAARLRRRADDRAHE